MTAAFSMGLLSLSRRTETSILDVGGGALYLRPRRFESCAEDAKLRNSPQRTRTAQKESVERRYMEMIVPVGLDVRRGPQSPILGARRRSDVAPERPQF